MKLNDLLQGVSVLEWHAEPDLEITGISYDSRKTQPGQLFVAMTGYETDGHAYIPAAAKAGAGAVLCQRPPEEAIPYILVEDSRLALALTSANWFGHPARQMCFLGITGTNGKTTTTYLLKAMLERCLGAKVGLIGTNQNMIGDQVLPTERTTPESYELQALFRAMADAGCTHVVMEVSSHALVLHRTAGIRFRLGLFTNLTQDHLDFHKDMADYAGAKALLFRQCETGILNLDDPWAERMRQGADCPFYTFSRERNEADLVAKNVRLSADRVEFEALVPCAIWRMEVPIPGAFTVHNALGAIACGLNLGIPLEDIGSCLREIPGVKGRMEVVPTGRDFTVLIDYAHTPDALEKALASVKECTKGRLIALFGCGGDRDPGKRPQMGAIAARLADLVMVTSDNPRTEEPGAIIADILKGMEGTHTPYEVVEDRRAAIRRAMDLAEAGDVILLAGKGHEDYQIIGKEKRHLDEREEIAAHLMQMG